MVLLWKWYYYTYTYYTHIHTRPFPRIAVLFFSDPTRYHVFLTGYCFGPNEHWRARFCSLIKINKYIRNIYFFFFKTFFHWLNTTSFFDSVKRLYAHCQINCSDTVRVTSAYGTHELPRCFLACPLPTNTPWKPVI